MRLLAYTDAAGVGGAEISLANLLEELRRDAKLDITVLGRSPEVVERVTPPGASSVVAPIPRHPALIARMRPDVVHANLPTPWAGSAGLAAALALPRTRVLAVQQLPLRTVQLPLWLRTRELLRRLDAHVAVGEQSCRRMEDFYALGRGSLRSIPNYVPDVPPAQRRPPMPDPARGSSSGDGWFTVGSLGRLDRMKGYDLLLQAVAKIPEARLVVLGEGSERDALERQAEQLGIADRVQLRGWHAEPRTQLRDWDVFCLPSRSEGFPLSIVEAMLAGLPVVASRVGSVAEAVEEGRTGLLVDKDDVPGLTGALRQLRDPAVRSAMGQTGRERAAVRFTVAKMAGAYRSLYDELLAAPRRRRLRPGAEKA
jgi:glycosyltransferase involved in cell wall biosynthesis